MATVATHIVKLGQRGLNALLPANLPARDLPLAREMRSVAIIAPIFIGDCVLASVFFRNVLHQCSNGAKVYTISAPAQHNLLETLPGFTDHLVMPSTFSEKRELLRRLNCDAVFLLRFSLPWACAMMEAGVRYRIGYDLERFGLEKLQRWAGLLTHSIPSGRFDSTAHQMQSFEQTLRHIGWTWDSQLRPEIFLTDSDYKIAENVVAELNGPRVLIHASAGSPGKSWPLDYWAYVMEELYKAYGASFIAVGRADDTPIYQKLEAWTGIPIHNLCGKTTLRETAAICQVTDLVLTLDTSIAHMAAAVETPRLLVIYGPTNVYQWRPVITGKTRLEQAFLEASCRPCITRTCYHKSCTRLLMPERVMHQVHHLMRPQTGDQKP